MTDFTSSIQQIPYDADRVYASLSDLNNLSKVQSNIPEGAISELTFTSDTCSFNVPNIGTIALRIVEREPAKTVKLVTEKSPVPFTCWIQL
ncbi:MAG: SRPBCC family protein, partial [Bacteroidota bacterium]|nr:SRPBCC family protein [Bacteroidota bacterium]